RSLYKSKAQIAGEEDMLEVSLVVRPRRQERDDRRLTIGGRQRCQPLLQCAKETGEPLHSERAEQPSIHRRNEEPVLHCVAGPGGTLRAVGDDPPAAVRRAGEIATIKI